jgi:hypothetical protein
LFESNLNILHYVTFITKYVSVGMLPIYGNHLHDHFISLRGLGIHKTNLTPPLFSEVPVQSKESELLCVRDIEFTSFYDFSIGLWSCLNSTFSLVLLKELDNPTSTTHTI